MKKTIGLKNILLLIMMLAILVMPVQAALIVNKVTDEFSIQSPYPVDNVKSCQCGVRTEKIIVKNLGDFDTLYKAEVISPIQDLITVSDKSFNLAPGEEKVVEVYINTPCDTSLNTYYVVKICTNYGRSKEIYKNFVSQKCQNIKLECSLMNPDKEILPGDIVAIKADIQNVAGFQDTYDVAPQYYKEFTTQSSEKITVNPDDKKSVFIYVKLPVGQYGKIDYPIVVSSEKGANNANCLLSFDIAKDYDYSVKTDEFEISACDDVAKQSIITIENLAKTPNKYYMYLSAPGFVNLSQKQLSLDAGEKENIALNINPKHGNAGTYDLTLSIGTEYGQMEKQKSFKMTVKDCFDTKVQVGAQTCETSTGCDEKQQMWNSLSDRACTGQKNYVLNIRNDGLYEQTYQITADSPGWVSVGKDNEFVKLRPSQQINIPIKASLPDMDAKQASFVMVKQMSAPYEAHEVRIDLESLSERSCYNVELLQDKYSINYEDGSIPLLLQNTGLYGGTYNVALGDMDSKFVYLEDKEIKFNAGEMKVLRIAPKNASLYKQGTYLNQLTLKITPVDQGITYDRQFWIVLKDKSFVAKALVYIKNFNYSRIGLCGLATLILLVVLGLLIIGLIYMKLKKDLKIKRIKAAKMKKIKMLNIVLIGILILSVLVLFLLGNPDNTRFYEQPSNSTSMLYLEWKQNTPHQVDLNKYFKDPDMDALSYTSSQPDHIQVKIQGSIATLTPEFGWSGTEHIVFTANDGKGGLADGNVMTLHLLKKMPIGFMDYWNTYCKQVNIVIMMLIVVVILLLLDVVEEKGYNYYNPNKNRKK
jgi:hypothetical protein